LVFNCGLIAPEAAAFPPIEYRPAILNGDGAREASVHENAPGFGVSKWKDDYPGYAVRGGDESTVTA